MGEELRHVVLTYGWAREASTQVKEVSSNKGYEAESSAF